MSKVEIKLDLAAMSEFRKSEDVIAVLQEYANGIQQRAGDGFEVEEPYIGKTRANVAVGAANKKAFFKNLRENTLLKAMQ